MKYCELIAAFYGVIFNNTTFNLIDRKLSDFLTVRSKHSPISRALYKIFSSIVINKATVSKTLLVNTELASIFLLYLNTDAIKII